MSELRKLMLGPRNRSWVMFPLCSPLISYVVAIEKTPKHLAVLNQSVSLSKNWNGDNEKVLLG